MRWGTERSARYETLGAVPGSSTGTIIAGSATSHVKGSWTNVGSVTGFPYELLICSIVADTSSGDFVVDIGINAAGVFFAIAPDLRVSSYRTARGGGCHYQLPLHVPTGKQLAARAAGTIASSGVRVVLIGCSRGVRGAPGYGRMIALYTPALSRGEDLDPTVVDTDTAWTELIASTPLPVTELMLHFGQGAVGDKSTTSRHYLVDLAVGAAAAERALLSDILLGQDTTDDHPRGHQLGPLPIDLPAGSRLSARCRTSAIIAGQDQIDVAAWGLM